jgi:apolipoprotein N-acyltransferase
LKSLPRREALAALSGALLVLSFPKFGNGLVAFVALAPLLGALPGATLGQAFRLGYITGAVSALGLLYWTANVVVQYGGLSLPVGVGVMVLLCLAVALFPSVFACVVACWLQRIGPVALLAAPVAWVAMELLRAHTFFEFPWCLLGYSQHEHLPLIQVSAYTAVYGVSFLLVSVSAALAHFWLEPRSALARRALAGALTLVVLAGAHGAWTLSRPLPETGRIRVGLVQASILQDDKWNAARAGENVARHLELTHSAADRGARLVVWPESSLPFDLDRSPAFAEGLRTLVRRRELYLLFGNDDRDDAGASERRVWVGAKLLTPAGELAYRYHKIQLVPFGEYVPLNALLTLGGRVNAKLVKQVADFTPGTEPSVAPVDGHVLGTFICYEAIFPRLVRRFVSRGAELLVNITNDGWYGRTSAPYQHFAMARFRAVENGRTLVRAANTGITAVVDARGRVVARTRLFERTALVEDVPLISARTFYSRYGDVFAWACLGVALTLTGGTVRTRRR